MPASLDLLSAADRMACDRMCKNAKRGWGQVAVQAVGRRRKGHLRRVDFTERGEKLTVLGPAIDGEEETRGHGGTPYRQMSTGSLLCVRTFTATLPSRRRPRPRLAWEAITIRSQAFLSAVCRIPSAGYSLACTVAQAMSALRASLFTPDRIRAALSSAAFSYSSTG